MNLKILALSGYPNSTGPEVTGSVVAASASSTPPSTQVAGALVAGTTTLQTSTSTGGSLTTPSNACGTSTYDSRLISSAYPRLGEFYPSPPYADQASYMSHAFGTAANPFYPGLTHPYELKNTGNGSSWSSGVLPHSSCYSPHDASSLYNPYGERYAGMDSAARRKNATRETTNTLKAWLYEHRKNPYPTKGEKIMLAIITKMTLTQVSTWFANARRRLKKENKMTWSPRKRNEDDDTTDVEIANSNSAAESGNDGRVGSPDDPRRGRDDGPESTSLAPVLAPALASSTPPSSQRATALTETSTSLQTSRSSSGSSTTPSTACGMSSYGSRRISTFYPRLGFYPLSPYAEESGNDGSDGTPDDPRRDRDDEPEVTALATASASMSSTPPNTQAAFVAGNTTTLQTTTSTSGSSSLTTPSAACDISSHDSRLISSSYPRLGGFYPSSPYADQASYMSHAFGTATNPFYPGLIHPCELKDTGNGSSWSSGVLPQSSCYPPYDTNSLYNPYGERYAGMDTNRPMCVRGIAHSEPCNSQCGWHRKNQSPPDLEPGSPGYASAVLSTGS